MKWITRVSANHIRLVSRSSRAAEGGKQCKRRLSCDSKRLANQRRLFPRLWLCVWSQHCSGSKPIVTGQVFVNKTHLMSAHDPDIFPRLMNINAIASLMSDSLRQTLAELTSPTNLLRKLTRDFKNMAVECVDSAAYVGKILSERRKVSFQFLSGLLLRRHTRILIDKFCNFLKLVAKSWICFTGQETSHGKNASCKNQR